MNNDELKRLADENAQLWKYLTSLQLETLRLQKAIIRIAGELAYVRETLTRETR